MEKIEELRAKAMASMSASANPNISKLKDKTREEGELTSSEDGARTSSLGQSTSSTSPIVESDDVPPNKSTQNSEMGNHISLNEPANSGDVMLKTISKQNYSKHLDMNTVSSKSGNHHNPGWCMPPKTDNNLVISFSNDESDDSGSDSEGYRLERDGQKNISGVYRHAKPPLVVSHPKSDYSQPSAKYQMKRTPKKVSLSRTFISSMNKIHGANSKGLGSNPLKTTSLSLERGCNEGEISNNSKLEVLRKQIAMRENELNLQRKAVHEREKTNSGLYHDYNSIKFKSNATVSRPASLDTVEEPVRKRLKLEEPCRNKFNGDAQPKMLRSGIESLAKSKSVMLETNGPKDEGILANKKCVKGIHVETSATIASKKQGGADKQDPASRENVLIGVKNDASAPVMTSSTVPNLEIANKQGIESRPVAGIVTDRCQIDNGMESVDASKALNKNLLVAQSTAGVDEEDSSQVKFISPLKSTIQGLRHPSASQGHHSGFSAHNEVSCPQNLVRRIACNQVTPGDRILQSPPDDIFNKCPIDVPGSNCATSYVSEINTSIANSLGQPNFSRNGRMDLKTLMGMEEMQEKDLEEAQEHRHRCEVEERNALKAYREAQRALIEANARCTHLYRTRELFSVQRAFMMEDSSSLLSSRSHKLTETGMKSADNALVTYIDQFPSSRYQMQDQVKVLNQVHHDSNIRCTEVAPLHLSNSQTVPGPKLVSERCSNPNVSTSDIYLDKGDVPEMACSPPDQPNVSAHEDENAISPDHEAVQSRTVQGNDECPRKGGMVVVAESERNSPDNPQDYAHLEASLRSELFSRLRTKNMSMDNGLCSNVEHTIDKEAECLVGNKKSDEVECNQLSVVAEQHLTTDNGGTDRMGQDISKLSIQVQNQGHGGKGNVDESHKGAEPEDCSSSGSEACKSTVFVSSLPSLVFRSVFSHIINSSTEIPEGPQTRVPQMSLGKDCDPKFDGLLPDCAVKDFVRDTDMEEVSVSNACDTAIDPLWPLCMFELRGKCNDEKCVWQHVKDYSVKNVKQHNDCTDADCEAGTSSDLGEYTSKRNYSECIQRSTIPAPPKYLVGSDLLRGDFSNSLTANISARRSLLSDLPILRDTEGTTERRGSWNRQSLYLQSHDSSMKQLKQGLEDPEQCLDLALGLLTEEFNKLDGRKKALQLLSGGLLSTPTSVVLWVVYLNIYYRTEKAFGKESKDDMFLHAIRHNDGCYELWLMYINSCIQCNVRLLAYESALLALLRHASTPDGDKLHNSACILDLFLQMMDFLCMSGDTGKAIQRIDGLLDTSLHRHTSVVLSDILACLSESDKGIFWVCCVYLVIYRRLPDAVVEQFEFEKDFPFEIEWPSVELTTDAKNRALRLIEIGLDSVALGNKDDCPVVGSASRSAHLLAVVHVQCIALLEGFDCSNNLLNKYVKLYPTSLELVLTLARLHKKSTGIVGFEGFEDALSNWPRDTPGVQCIWNQYAQYALENKEVEFAKQLMVRWFNSVSVICCPQTGQLDVREYKVVYESSASPSSPKSDAYFTSLNSMDEMFGLLNLALFKWLQKDNIEARLVIDNALKVASPMIFKYCAREHAAFVFSNRSGEDTPGSGMLSILDSYLRDSRLLPFSEPLSRKFCQHIKNPRTKQLINKVLGEVSFDCSLMNSVLEAWYGPTLLPEKFENHLKDLVDHVEILMGTFPANYQLALSVCELIGRYCNTNGVVAFTTTVFWAVSLLINSMRRVVPVAPEKTWVEVARVLSNLVGLQRGISQRFHQQALSVYPFSVKLWKSYVELCQMTGNVGAVMDAAKEKGIKLD